MNDDRRKNPDDRVTRREWNDFREESNTYRCDQKKKLDSIHTALFAKDDQNEHGQVGVMVVMQKFDQHLDTLCAAAKLGKKGLKFVFWFITAAGGAVAAAKAAGWL